MRHLSKRRSFNWVLAGLVLVLCGWIHLGWSPASPAQEWDNSEFGQDPKNSATLVFDFDRQGQASAFFSIFYPRERSPSPQDWTGIAQSLNMLMPGCSFESRGAGESRDYGFFKGNCDATFSHQGHQRWLISRFLDLTPLFQQLTAVAPTPLDLRLSLPNLGIARTVPALTQTGALPFPIGGLDQPVRYSQSFQSNQPVLPIAIEFGYRPRDILLRGLSIPTMIILPVALLWVLRNRALRSRAADPAPVWFGYLRSLNFLVVGTWVIWSGVHIAVGLGDVLTFILGKGIAIDLMQDVIFFTPPCLSTILCFALSHPVYVKLGQSDLTRADLIQQAFWSQLNIVLPLLLLLTAIKAFFGGNLAIGLVYIVASQTSRLILAPIALKASGLTTQSITTGDLRDRIFGLAQLAGVKLQQVYVIPIGRGKMANAFAVEGGSVWLTDYLLKNMSREEVDAVMAHELAHFQLGHHQSRQLVTIVTLLLFGFLVVPFIMLFSTWLPSLPWLIPPLCIITVLMASTFHSRKHEHQADIQAGVLTQNPAAMITALVKLSRLSRIPLQWGKSQEFLSTHPSTQKRINAIAQRHNISELDVERLVNDIDHPAEHYELPNAIASDQLLFSTSFKKKRLLYFSWLLLLTPVLTACLLSYLALQIKNPWIVPMGSLAIVLLLLLISNYTPFLSCGGLQHPLRQKLQRQGFQPQIGMMVGLAPHATLQTYEGFLMWDIGYLWLEGDRLCYIGEQAQFAIPFTQIIVTHLKRTSPGWWQMPQIYITWQDPDRPTSSTFYLMPYASSCQQEKRLSHQLNQQVQSWLANPSSHPSSILFNSLTSPEITTVSSQAITPQILMQQLINTFQVVIPLTLAMGILFHLPFGFEVGSVWYAVLLAGLAQIFLSIPLWRYVRQHPAT